MAVLSIRQVLKRLFSDLYQEGCHIYDLCNFEEEGRCSDHKDCAACKKSATDIRKTDILTHAVIDNDLKTELRKLKGKGRERKQDYMRKLQTGTWIMQPKISIMPLKQ